MFEVDGIGDHLVLTLLSEVGMDLSAFPNAKHFVSWLGLCPNKKVTGGKVISSKTKKNKSRLKHAFRQAAIGMAKRKDQPLAHFYRRMASKHGKGTAITSTARKIAIIVYNMLQYKQAYQPQSLVKYQQRVRQQKIKQIQRTIQKFEVKLQEVNFS